MKFQLDFSIAPSQHKISYKDKITLFGSCFAENIGEKFHQNKFHTNSNPYGILFNPHSISLALIEIIKGKIYSSSDLIFHNSLYVSMNHHGSFSQNDKISTIQKINTEITNANLYLKEVGWLIITFGSAYCYKYKANNNIVANCHKIPNIKFEKIFLQTKDIISNWKNCISELQSFNPNLKIIFTVSPVRYIRDGLIENNKSKATLLSAVHEICSQEKDCFYFPSYEIVNDVLRDYRFFKEDMVHPTQQAINFVWKKFNETLFEDDTQKILAEIESFQKLNLHKSLHMIKVLTEQQSAARIELQKKYPFLSWESA